jgi:tRNA A37 threonylcarbamoyladenosine dehydratase
LSAASARDFIPPDRFAMSAMPPAQTSPPPPSSTALPADYRRRFSGVERLYGAAALPRLHAAHVAVIGVGGVGSWTVEALARSGVGALTLVDADEVCVTNVNRQLPALDDTVGRPKVVVLAERVRAINPGCRVRAEAEFFTATNADRILDGGFSYVVEATDSLQHKLLCIVGCRRRALPVLTVGGAGGKRDATAVRLADLAFSERDRLLRMVRKRLRQRHGFPRDESLPFGVPCVFSSEAPVYPRADGTVAAQPEPGADQALGCDGGLGSAAFVTGAFGFAAAGAVVRAIAAGGAEPFAAATPAVTAVAPAPDAPKP